jgi:hypothetical protein
LQLHKTCFRNTLAGCTVTICEHLDCRVSVRWDRICSQLPKAQRDGGKDAASGAMEISPKPGYSHFAHRLTTIKRTLKSKTSSKAA